MANRYWVGDSGTWDNSSTTHWSASSGGASGASNPTSSDNVFFDSNSFSANGFTVTISQSGGDPKCNNLDLSGSVKMFTINSPLANQTLDISGNIIGSNKVTITDAGLGFSQITTGNSLTIQSNGMIFGVFSPTGSGTCTLLDDFSSSSPTSSNALGIGSPTLTFNANGFNVTTSSLLLSSSPTINFGTGTWTIKPTITSGDVFQCLGSSVTLNVSTSSLVFDLSLISSSTVKFTAPNHPYIYPNLTIKGNSASNTLYFNTTNCAFSNFLIQQAPITVKWSSGATYTIGSLNANGSSGNLITFITDNSGSTTTISATTVSTSYVDVKDNIAAGMGVLFQDYPGGVDSGNNTNWCFTSGCHIPVNGAFLLNFM